MSGNFQRSGFMDQALEEARQAASLGEVPVGAVLVKDGEVIARAHNLVLTDKDPTAHAELIVIREGARLLQNERLTGCDLYVTLEPCAMCAQAMAFARIRRLYFGAGDPKGGGVIHGARIFEQPTCHHRPEVYEGIGEAEASRLLKDFFKEKRSA